MLAPVFTGLVQSVGLVRSVTPSGAGASVLVEASGWARGAALGDSISVSGCCLTVAEGSDPSRGLLRFDVVRETLSRTTLGGLAGGSRVNLERSVRADTLMGGHFVQGHVEGVGSVQRVDDSPGDWRLRVKPAGELLDCIAPKGSIAIDGVSLTIAALVGESFEIALIPTTLERTTLGALRAGDRVNIETDILARQVVHALRRAGLVAGRSER
jgi:riboflavin synthase